MSSFTPTSKHLPCDICGDTSGKCRVHKGGEILLCMPFSNARFGEIQNGYKCIKEDKGKGWSTWKIDNTQEWTEQQRREWKQRLEAKKRQQALENEALHKKALSEQEKHQQYSKLLAELTLHPSDRADLVRRGFTKEQIELSGFKSVENWQSLQGKYSNLLPGVSNNSRFLLTGTGYLCPVRNAEGLIVALQVRLQQIDSNWSGRYRWLSSATKKNPTGQSPHIYHKGFDPELPLAIHKPAGRYHGIALAEGTGAKPFLAAQRLNLIVIGAAGGQHASSPNQLKSALKLCIVEQVPILADAGSPSNKNVVAQYLRTAELLIQWGYTPVFGWWGQTSKDDPDIDELPPERYEEIEYLSVAQFKALASEHGGYSEREDLAQKYLLPIPELPTVGFHSSRTTMQELKRVFGDLDSSTGKEWLQLRSFTPDHVINQQYFDWEPPKSGEGLAVKSGLGTGKSWWANQKYLANPDDGAAIGGYRNVLLEQFCSNGHELNGRHWNQIQGDLKANGELVLLADLRSRIAGAVDSWGYFSPHHFEEKKIIIDEVEGVTRHLHHSNTAVSMYRESIKQRVIDALQNGHSFTILDGNLTDFTVEYYEKLSGRKITKIQNTYTGNRGKIFLYDGSSRRRKASQEDVENGLASQVGEWIEFDVRADDYSKLHKIMMELPTDIPIIITSDSQVKCETWDLLLSEKGRKVFRLDSTTSNTDLGKEFLRDPKAFILAHGINTVILSPSAESGVSIDMKKTSNSEIIESLETIESTMPSFFKYEFAFFFGIVSTDTQVQFLGRNRDPETIRFVFCKNHSSLHKKIGFENLTSGQLQQAFVEYTLNCAKVSLSGLDEAEKANKKLDLAIALVEKSEDPHYEYECRLIAKENFERKHPRLCLEYALRDSGWNVVTVRGTEDDLKELSFQQNLIQLAEAEATHSEETLSPSEADKLARKLNKTPSERRQITKSRLLSRLPGFESKTIQEERKVLPSEISEVVGNHKIVEIDGVSSSEDGFAEKLQVLQQLAVQQQSEVDPNSPQQATGNDTEEIRCDNRLENEGVTQPESQSTEGLNPVTQPPDNSKKTRGVVSHPITVTFSKPAFDPLFIHTARNKDRNLIPRIESQFLLLNPEAAKLLQQQRWYKKLSIFTDPSEPDCKKKIHLATYRSKWLQIHTLLSMGIGWFLNPENTWHKESPELLEFWEKGKDPKNQRNVGVSAQNAEPCQYLGKVLLKFGLSTKRTRKRINGEPMRLYCIEKSIPLHQAIFESVAERINSKISEFVFDWKSICDNTLQFGGVAQVETQSTQGVDPVTQPTDNSIKTSGVVSHGLIESDNKVSEKQCTNISDMAEPLQPPTRISTVAALSDIVQNRPTQEQEQNPTEPEMERVAHLMIEALKLGSHEAAIGRLKEICREVGKKVYGWSMGMLRVIDPQSAAIIRQLRKSSIRQ
ncbi:MAG: hypothetical protein F6K14_17905 [Symploca sp. SIO2C1]|nr:hypothetical protein [Symploca sp. SIO2C1]